MATTAAGIADGSARRHDSCANAYSGPNSERTHQRRSQAQASASTRNSCRHFACRRCTTSPSGACANTRASIDAGLDNCALGNRARHRALVKAALVSLLILFERFDLAWALRVLRVLRAV
ncbi:hypothetical protein [Pseudomonas sp. C9-3]|uniref:hypothetical protein n=1 Tax=Pseudomonas sp. C9-3 TaxID=3078264 RepID=UPI0028EE2989|nr:hypothetical protein [Pseudomonas sp. C9-3]